MSGYKYNLVWLSFKIAAVVAQLLPTLSIHFFVICQQLSYRFFSSRTVGFENGEKPVEIKQNVSRIQRQTCTDLKRLPGVYITNLSDASIFLRHIPFHISRAWYYSIFHNPCLPYSPSFHLPLFYSCLSSTLCSLHTYSFLPYSSCSVFPTFPNFTFFHLSLHISCPLYFCADIHPLLYFYTPAF